MSYIIDKKNQEDRILHCFAFLDVLIKMYNAKGLVDVNRYAEDFFIPVLDMIFDTKFKNLNVKKPNAEFVDLANPEATIAIQITSNHRNEKLIQSAAGIFKKNPDAKFYYLLLCGKMPVYEKTTISKIKEVNKNFTSENVIDLKILSDKIMQLSNENIITVLQWLEKLSSGLGSQHRNIYDGFTKLDDVFWRYTACLPCTEYITNLNSNPNIICSAIQNDLVIDFNYEFRGNMSEYNIWEILREIADGSSTKNLFECIGASGEGKSTFMFKIAHLYYDKFDVFWLRDNKFIKGLSEISHEKPVMILINQVETLHESWSMLVDLCQGKFTNGCVVIIAEQSARWDNWPNKKYFTASFLSRYSLKIKLKRENVNSVFKKMRSIHKTANSYHFVDNKKWTISDHIINYFEHSGHELYTYIKTDWDTWDEITKDEVGSVRSLYAKIAFLNYYGIDCPVKELFNLFQLNFSQLEKISQSNENYPLVISDEVIRLRHQKLAGWYFLKHPSQLDLIRAEFKNRINSPTKSDTSIIRKLLRSDTFLNDISLGQTEVIAILKKYKKLFLGDVEECIKNTCEMAKVLFWKLENRTAAYEALHELKREFNLQFLQLEYKFLIADDNWLKVKEDLDELRKEKKNDIHIQRIWNEFKLKELKEKQASVRDLIRDYDEGNITLPLCLAHIFRRGENVTIEKLKTEFLEFYQLQKEVFDFEKVLDLLPSDSILYKNIVLEIIGPDWEHFSGTVKLEIFFYKCAVNQYKEALKILKDIGIRIESITPLKHFLLSFSRFERPSYDRELLNEIIRIIVSVLDNPQIAENSKPFIYKYLQIVYYRFNEFEEVEKLTTVLENAVAKYENNSHLKYVLVKHYLRFYDDPVILAKVDSILVSVPEVDKNHPEYIMTRARYLYSIGEMENANEMLATLEDLNDYNSSAIFIRINNLFARKRFREVLSLITMKIYDLGDYTDKDANEIFLKSSFTICKCDSDIINEYETNLKYFKRLFEEGFKPAKFFEFAYEFAKRNFELDPVALRREVLNEISVENIYLCLDLIKLLGRTGHFTQVDYLLGFIRKAPGFTKYYQSNRLIVFLNFMARMIALDEICIDFAPKGKHLVKPYKILKGDFSIELIEQHIDVMNRGNNYRRAIVFLYILWRECLIFEKRQHIFRLLRDELSKFSGRARDMVVTLTKDANGFFTYEHNNRIYKYFDDEFAKKVATGWQSKASYLYLNLDTQRTFFAERYFVINGEKNDKSAMQFETWLRNNIYLKEIFNDMEFRN